ncbi:MAG: DUF6282 family protein [Candidatus Acidiferrales bacterium]|jgi:hypothetical protein
MNSQFWRALIQQMSRAWICLFLLAVPAYGQSDLDLKGAIDTRVHSSPDNVARSIDADDLAQLAKRNGMRGLVLTNHWESTAALAYMVRKQVPGIEIFGGIEMDQSVGGINVEAVKRMTLMKGGWGKVVWLPTFDSETFANWVKKDGKGLPYSTTTVPISRDGHLLPSVLELIDFVAQHHELLLETGHNSAQEALMVVHEAHQRGVTHIIVTGAMDPVVDMKIPQMQQAAHDGAYIEFAYSNAFGAKPEHTMSEFADAIGQVGPKFCILSTNFVDFPLHPQALLDFMEALHKEGISVADINLMAKNNPALALGLKP